MRVNWKKLLLFLAVPLAVGGLAALLSGGMSDYAQLKQPPLAPPGWLFPIMWTILYLLMGYASYRVLTSGAAPEDVRPALWVYGIQLFLNFLWPIFFFGQQWRLSAFFLLIALWILILVTMRLFSKIDERAGDLLIPYSLWVTFAGYLNFGIYLLN